MKFYAVKATQQTNISNLTIEEGERCATKGKASDLEAKSFGTSKKTLTKAYMFLCIFCILAPASADVGYEIRKFNTSPGVYFENI